MKHYAKCMHKGSELLMSGFYVDDIPALQEEAAKHGLRFVHHKEKNRWAAVHFVME
jgi:ribosomal protein L11 methyltransferase